LEYSGEWSRNAQNRYYAQQQYLSNCKTLSASPFIPWEKITGDIELKNYISTAEGKKGVCNFPTPDFRNPIDYICDLPEETILQILTPYFLSENKQPNIKDALIFLRSFKKEI
jgi:hypothetical protein